LSIKLTRLKNRIDFLKVSKFGCSFITPSFILQVCSFSYDKRIFHVRVGYTASKKIGKAIIRNKCKRRLRSLVDGIIPFYGIKGMDYVLVARVKCSSINFAKMKIDLLKILEKFLENSKNQNIKKIL
jgi:ribonuclease P protein component